VSIITLHEEMEVMSKQINNADLVTVESRHCSVAANNATRTQETNLKKTSYSAKFSVRRHSPHDSRVQCLSLRMTFHIDELTTGQVQYFLQHLIAPRPIALASTIDQEGAVNLSPFSFFNLFSAKPPIVIFSPARRVRNNTTKHTLDNIRQVPEVAISIVTADIVQQASLASGEFAKGTDEFIKAGFTKLDSRMIAPPRVSEAKASLECRVKEIKSLGDHGGAGQLVIAEVVCVHIHDVCMTADGKIDQEKIEHVARLGGEWYACITPACLFRVSKPHAVPAIGFDALPEGIKNSTVLSGNYLARLAGVTEVPVRNATFSDERLAALKQYIKPGNGLQQRIHRYAKELIDDGQIEQAWQVLLADC
jgi:flavin reductase (DIM6/NTAB) family NADH-FMN oxidoreductase RutF